MGFGINPSKVSSHQGRLWSFPVLFTIEDGFSIKTRNDLMYAMADWGNGANQGPLFQPVAQAGAGVVVVKKTSGSNMWQSGDTLAGKKPDGSGGQLFLKDGAGYDTLERPVNSLNRGGFPDAV